MKCLVAYWVRNGEAPPIFPKRIRPGHENNILRVVLDVDHLSGEDILAEWDRFDAVLEEVALLLECAESPFL